MMKTRLTALALACMAAATAHAQNISAGTLAAAAQKAISNNPEVTARLNALRASANEVDVARGGYYPRVDLSADVAGIATRSPPATRNRKA